MNDPWSEWFSLRSTHPTGLISSAKNEWGFPVDRYMLRAAPAPNHHRISPLSSDMFAQDPARRRSIAFLNWAHALDHYVMLIFPTVVIGLQAIYGRSYAELIALSTASFVAFGVFSLPAGWLADHWS